MCNVHSISSYVCPPTHVFTLHSQSCRKWHWRHWSKISSGEYQALCHSAGIVVSCDCCMYDKTVAALGQVLCAGTCIVKRFLWGGELSILKNVPPSPWICMPHIFLGCVGLHTCLVWSSPAEARSSLYGEGLVWHLDVTIDLWHYMYITFQPHPLPIPLHHPRTHM